MKYKDKEIGVSGEFDKKGKKLKVIIVKTCHY